MAAKAPNYPPPKGVKKPPPPPPPPPKRIIREDLTWDDVVGKLKHRCDNTEKALKMLEKLLGVPDLNLDELDDYTIEVIREARELLESENT